MTIKEFLSNRNLSKEVSREFLAQWNLFWKEGIRDTFPNITPVEMREHKKILHRNYVEDFCESTFIE